MNVIHKIGVILFLLCPYISLYGQEGKDTLMFRIVSYNVENLFDSRHDTLKNDYEFLPDATRHWNYSKYRKKLDNIARVIIATGGWTPPALVALCEVENDSVMRDLTRYSALREADYRYVMTQSPDKRGIDVALLYQRNLFKLLSYQSLPVDKPRKNSRPTRDILHINGLLLNRDTLDVLVAHFPSRSGGARESEPYRLLAARKVKHAIDSLYTIRRQHCKTLYIHKNFTIYWQEKPKHASTSAATSIKENGDYWTTSSYRVRCCKNTHRYIQRKRRQTYSACPSY